MVKPIQVILILLFFHFTKSKDNFAERRTNKKERLKLEQDTGSNAAKRQSILKQTTVKSLRSCV